MEQQAPFFFKNKYVDENKDTCYSSIFCIHLHSIENPSNNGYEGHHYDKAILLDGFNNQIDFINTLYRTDIDCTYTIRYISHPNNKGFASGDIDIVLFCHVTSHNETICESKSKSVFKEVLLLISTMLKNYHWNIVSNESVFMSFFEPFPLENISLAEIRRREDFIALNSFNLNPSLISSRTGGSCNLEESTHGINFVHRYIQRYNEFSRILNLLLSYDSPIIFQVSLTPMKEILSTLTHIAEQISTCEKYLQQIVTSDQTFLQSKTIYKERVQYLIEALMDQYFRLQDAPFYLQTLLISNKPIPQSIIETTGVEITNPIGSNYMNNNRILDLQAGGYDVCLFSPNNTKKINPLDYLSKDIHSTLGEEITDNQFLYLFDASEAVCAFRLPIALSEEIPGIDSNSVKSLPLPREIASLKKNDKKNTYIGQNYFLGYSQGILLSEKDRSQHLYTIGQTGTGKTTLLKTMILSDIDQGNGVAVIDPHGDLFEELIGLIPESRKDDVIVFDPSDNNYPVGMNLLDAEDEEESHYIVREMKAIIEKLLEDQFGYQNALNYTGPLFYQHMQMNLLLVMSNPKRPGTLLDFYEVFQREDYWKKWREYKGKDKALQRWIDSNLPNINYTDRSRGESSIGEYVSSKFEDFVFDPLLRNIFGQSRSTINFAQIMNSNKIFLVNLAKGKLTESNSKFLGMIIISKLYAAAMKRVNLPQKDRKMFYLYVDEFQSLATQNFSMILSEARKFSLGLILANQFVSQIKNPMIMDAIFGNVGTFVTFRVGREDARIIAPSYYPYYTEIDLMNLPNRNAIVKTKCNGQIVKPFSLETVLPRQQFDKDLSKRMKDQSRKCYGRTIEEVKIEIENSLKAYDPRENKLDKDEFESILDSLMPIKKDEK